MSDEVQRLVRKLQPAGPRSVDEHTWPIYVAIVVLCGYLCGVVLSLLHFDDPQLHSNALTWCGVIIVAGAIGLWSVSLLQNTIVRRTFILSILLSLIINVSLLLMMAWTWIFAPTWNDPNPKTVAENKKREVVVPEYPLFNEKQQQRVPQEYERPVETGEPDADKRVELTRQSTQPEMQANEPTLSASATATDSPAMTMPRRADAPSAPRQNEQLSKLSRQTLRSQPNISRRVKPTENLTPTRPSPTQPSAATTATNSPTRQPTNAPAMNVEADVAPQRVETTAMARSSDNATPDSPVASLPTLNRRMARPRQLPSTSTPIASQESRAMEVNEAVEPNSTLMAKQTTSAPEKTVRTELQPKVATQLDRTSRMDQPQSETLSSSLARATLSNEAARSSKVNSEAAEIPVEASPNAQALTASAPQVTQRRNEAVANAKTDAPRSETKLSPSTQSVARAAANENPSVSVTSADRRSPNRPNRIARSTASPRTDVPDSVVVESAESSTSPATQPSRMALSRSSIGVAGVGNASNLERGLAAPNMPVNIASASANRARATQDMEQGPSLAPSKPSVNRRMRANNDSPSTSMQAQPIDSAMVAGANAPAAEASSSSATLERASSNAMADTTTAAKGSTEVDLGPTRIAADTGTGRAEGGGQPEVVTGERPRALPRENAIAGKAGIRTNTEAANSTAPAAENAPSGDVGPSAATGTDIVRSQSEGTVSGAGDNAGLESSEVGEVRVARATGQRADSDEGDSAPSLATGGTASPGRRARSLQVRTATNSQMPSLAGLDASDGSRNGEPLDAQGARPRQAAAGLLSTNTGEVGALDADQIVDGTADGLPTASFQRGGDSSDEPANLVAISSSSRGAPRRSSRMQVAGASTEVELDPEEFAANLPGSNVEDALDEGDGLLASAETGRLSGGSLMVDIEAPDADGGLGVAPAVNAGILTRTANEDSELVSLQPSRFLRRTRPGASVTTKTNVVSPTKAFRRRIIRKGEELAGERGLPSPKTEAAIELGLVFLSRYQSADGSWSFNNFADGKAELPDDEEAIMVSDSAATGLALLSYLGAGYHHKSDQYQEHVRNGLDFLVQHQREDGDLYIDQDPNSSRSAWMYSHAIATLALCEAYGMTQDSELKQAAQKAVNFIIESQHPSRGGWRYSPAYGSDTSVSGWMTMALKSADLANLNVPSSVYRKIEHWLDLAQASEARPYLFRYNPYAPDTDKQRHGLKPTRAITAVGLLMRLYTDWKRTDENMILGARTLAQNPPELGTSSRPRRDTYYWYYATQVMFHMGGEYWSAWNQALHPMLSKTQVKDGPLAGSWNPILPIPDRWGSFGGRLYVTTMNLLSLEVFYRHMPLYEESSK